MDYAVPLLSFEARQKEVVGWTWVVIDKVGIRFFEVKEPIGERIHESCVMGVGREFLIYDPALTPT